ncbi:MAG: TM2 domain-containing protein [Bacteroidetes bacterium]|nr:TM2 domain-containing protein [Bacteroidota bacterium]
MKFTSLFLFLCLFGLNKIFAEQFTIYVQTENGFDSIVVTQKEAKQPKFLLRLIEKQQAKDSTKSKHLTAAALAFPFPFGIVGLHRIYLGCAPYVPIVYIATLGGMFGVLPFIDFCVLLVKKKIDKYMNNKKVFMWIDDENL